MKKHCKFLLVTLFSLFILGACSTGDDDTTEPAPKPQQDQVTISTTELEAEANGGSGTLSFTTNQSWAASSDQTWCKLDKTSGNAGNITINLAFGTNPTEQERTAKITITAGTATAEATIKQAKKEAEGGDQGGEEGGGESGSDNGNTIEDTSFTTFLIIAITLLASIESQVLPVPIAQTGS